MKITCTILLIIITTKSIYNLCFNNCKTCDKDTFCLECNSGYVLSIDNKCIQKPKCDHCKKCDEKFQCTECNEGYDLKDHKCIEKICSDCVNCSYGKCMKCFDEFILVNGKCFSNNN